MTQSTSIAYNFKVIDSQTPKSQLLVTATSSNANLVPNDSMHLACSSPAPTTGIGMVTITPLALPSPSRGVPQSATITLAVTDDAYTRRKQFLYVAKNPASHALSFSRPTGVYNLDPGAGDHRPDDLFLTGEMRRISWNCIDNGDPNPLNWNWSSLDQAFTDVQGRDLSLNLIEEPCYIATHQDARTWCDTSRGPTPAPHCNPTPTPCATCMNGTGILRALPWDPYLQQQRKIFLQALAAHPLPNGTPVANEPRIPIINPNLPGGDTGIRELNNMRFSSDFDGYTRQALLAAVQTELRTVMQ